MATTLHKIGDRVGVLFSGGQDSATVLAWALQRFDHVETIGFAYGQRHEIELTARQTLLERTANFVPNASQLGQDHIIDLAGFGAISDTALTREREIETLDSGLPNTFVPGRNLVFLTYSAAVGWRRGFTHLAAGMCEADFSGYPDCRAETLDTQMKAISLGMDKVFKLHTPLMHRSKAQAWELAEEIGGEALVNLICTDSHTCYRGVHDTLHDWGYGCGECPACELRANGWATYRAAKQTV
jgi:7-cyano-7-deazaguanine synthase